MKLIATVSFLGAECKNGIKLTHRLLEIEQVEPTVSRIQPDILVNSESFDKVIFQRLIKRFELVLCIDVDV